MSKKESKHKVEIEICSNCKSHSWCTRHDEKRYEGIFDEISKAVAARDPDIEVVKKLAGDKKMGAFEVTCNGKVLFSKLTFGYFPLTKSVTDTIVAFVQDNRNGKDVAAYDIGHEKYRRVESMARSGISMKSKSKSPSPKRQENFRPYRKEQLGIKMVESKVQQKEHHQKTSEKEHASKHKTDESVNDHQNNKQTVKQEPEKQESKKPQEQKKAKEKSTKVIKEPETVVVTKEQKTVEQTRKEQKLKTAPKEEEKKPEEKKEPKKQESKVQKQAPKEEPKKEVPKEEPKIQTPKQEPKKQAQEQHKKQHPRIQKHWQAIKEAQNFNLHQK